ncbi:hypothetical protein WJX72_007428 [[Myrmecia] bisecta]|uniref:Transmembrane protein 115 n=1 Tax=[Myrmecia] bisecta TaxID=41462 RepID=A0AAW1R831_9CHLO
MQSGYNLTFTKLSRAIAVLLITGYFTQLLVPSTRQYLALVAGRSLPCVWNIFSAGLLETSLIELGFGVAGILLVAKVVEPVWGSKEFLKFIAVVNVSTGLATLIVVYCIYALDQYSDNAGAILYKEIAGFHGVLAGCLVAIKQIMPDSEVTLLVVLKFRAKHLPALFLLSAAGASVMLKQVINTVPFVVFGTYVAWLYLRFFQIKPETSLKGDPSNEFRFATFFPEFLQPAVDKVAGACARLGPGAAGAAGPGYVLGATPLPGSDNADATRRRERGARALEERLGGRKAAPPPGPAVMPPSQDVTDIEAGQKDTEAIDTGS